MGDQKALKEMLTSRQRGLSVQFVQFGDGEEATVEFGYMDNHLIDSAGEKLP
jgi:hypothetical protein